jgi:hypothetical protein
MRTVLKYKKLLMAIKKWLCIWLLGLGHYRQNWHLTGSMAAIISRVAANHFTAYFLITLNHMVILDIMGNRVACSLSVLCVGSATAVGKP